MHFMPVTPEKAKAPRMRSYNHGTLLATREMHYAVNPKHDQLVGTVLLFATKKAKAACGFISCKRKDDHCAAH